jgi:hypothetical protein
LFQGTSNFAGSKIASSLKSDFHHSCNRPLPCYAWEVKPRLSPSGSTVAFLIILIRKPNDLPSACPLLCVARERAFKADNSGAPYFPGHFAVIITAENPQPAPKREEEKEELVI